jgi:hypothetical protein
MINPLPWMEVYHFQLGTAAAVEEGGKSMSLANRARHTKA